MRTRGASVPGFSAVLRVLDSILRRRVTIFSVLAAIVDIADVSTGSVATACRGNGLGRCVTTVLVSAIVVGATAKAARAATKEGGTGAVAGRTALI